MNNGSSQLDRFRLPKDKKRWGSPKHLIVKHDEFLEISDILLKKIAYATVGVSIFLLLYLAF